MGTKSNRQACVYLLLCSMKTGIEIIKVVLLVVIAITLQKMVVAQKELLQDERIATVKLQQPPSAPVVAELTGWYYDGDAIGATWTNLVLLEGGQRKVWAVPTDSHLDKVKGEVRYLIRHQSQGALYYSPILAEVSRQ